MYFIIECDSNIFKLFSYSSTIAGTFPVGFILRNSGVLFYPFYINISSNLYGPIYYSFSSARINTARTGCDNVSP